MPGEGNENGGGFDTNGNNEHWSDTHDEITSNVDIHNYAKKYGSEFELAKAGYEITKKLGASFRLPDDLSTLTEEQKGELHSRMRSLKNVPETAEGYEIAKPENLPEGMPYDETIVEAFKQFAHERGMDTKDVNELVGWYNNAMISLYNKNQERMAQAANQAETEMRVRWGADFDKKMEAIKRVRMRATEELGFGYKNEQGEICSHLDDCLDATGLGNKAPVLELLAWIEENFIAEGVPVEASGGEKGEGSSFFDYDKVDK